MRNARRAQCVRLLNKNPARMLTRSVLRNATAFLHIQGSSTSSQALSTGSLWLLSLLHRWSRAQWGCGVRPFSLILCGLVVMSLVGRKPYIQRPDSDGAALSVSAISDGGCSDMAGKRLLRSRTYSQAMAAPPPPPLATSSTTRRRASALCPSRSQPLTAVAAPRGPPNPETRPHSTPTTPPQTSGQNGAARDLGRAACPRAPRPEPACRPPRRGAGDRLGSECRAAHVRIRC